MGIKSLESCPRKFIEATTEQGLQSLSIGMVPLTSLLPLGTDHEQNIIIRLRMRGHDKTGFYD